MDQRETAGLRGMWLGTRPYGEVLKFQEELVAARKRGQIVDTALFVEHPPVITMGRGSKAENLLAGADQLAALGVELFPSGRGGDVTVHAPGQLVCYPVVQLGAGEQDVRRYVRGLTSVMAEVALRSGVSGGEVQRMIGLWVDAESPSRWPGEDAAVRPVKVGAIGVKISRWVTMHGFALNLMTDLRWFSLIVPCGIADRGVETVGRLSQQQLSVAESALPAYHALAKTLQRAPLAFAEHTGPLQIDAVASATHPGR